MEHRVERLRKGLEPDDLIDPEQLRPLTRNSLKTAFRAVIRVQRGIAVTLSMSPR
jgi:signal-transduction protein with cAMP-binding, CBS, and nucleotidyltransferase domain